MPITLDFDRGTLSLAGRSGAVAVRLPGVLRDSRTRTYRAPAYRYAALREALASGGHSITDRVLEDRRDPAGPCSRSWQVVELRTYQASALAAWSSSNARGWVSLPTGAGKTRVAIAAMAACACRTLCLVPTRVLLAHWRRSLEAFYAGPIGQSGDGVRDARAVTIATFASALHHMSTLGNRFDLVIVDEADHFGTGAGDEVLEMCAAPARLGLLWDAGEADHLSLLDGIAERAPARSNEDSYWVYVYRVMW